MIFHTDKYTMARQTRKYADLDAVFTPNPVTGDLSLRTDEAAVKFAIKNLILTRNYERPFDSSIGSQLKRYLFEPMDNTTIILMRQVIAQTITNHEPRVDLISIGINSREDSNELTVTVNFKIKNTEKPLTLTLALDRTR